MAERVPLTDPDCHTSTSRSLYTATRSVPRHGGWFTKFTAVSDTTRRPGRRNSVVTGTRVTGSHSRTTPSASPAASTVRPSRSPASLASPPGALADVRTGAGIRTGASDRTGAAPAAAAPSSGRQAGPSHHRRLPSSPAAAMTAVPSGSVSDATATAGLASSGPVRDPEAMFRSLTPSLPPAATAASRPATSVSASTAPPSARHSTRAATRALASLRPGAGGNPATSSATAAGQTRPDRRPAVPPSCSVWNSTP